MQLNGLSIATFASVRSSFIAGLAATLRVPVASLTVGEPVVTGRSGRRAALQSPDGITVPFAVSVGTSEGVGDRAEAMSVAISSTASAASSPLIAALEQAGVTLNASQISVDAPTATVVVAVEVPLAPQQSAVAAAEAINNAVVPGGAVQLSLQPLLGESADIVAGETSVVLPPPQPPPSPLPPPNPPPRPRPPLPPLPPLAPVEPKGCDLFPCFPGVVWCGRLLFPLLTISSISTP